MRHPSNGSINEYLDDVGDRLFLVGSFREERSKSSSSMIAVIPSSASSPQPATHVQTAPATVADRMRTCVGVVPVHRLKALVKALTSWKPTNQAICEIERFASSR
jgi:hypothetical protein